MTMTRNPNPGYRKNILPGLQVPAGLAPELHKFLQSLKEHIEQYTGSKGQPGERFVTLEDLKRAGLANYVVKRGRGEIGSKAEETAAARSAAGSGSTATELAELGDVVAGTAAAGDTLVYTGGLWRATTVFPSQMEFEDGIVVGDLEFSAAAELTAALGTFTDTLQGVVPASAGGTTNFLRADGTWAAPPGGGGTLVYSNTTIPVGNTVADTAVESTFESTYTIPADELEEGSVIRVRLVGVYSTDASVAPTLQLRVKLGDQTIIDTAAVALATGAANDGWCIDVLAIAHSIGATGELEAQGLRSLAGDLANIVNTSTFTIDTTADLALTVTAQWGTADADNTVTLREMVVYVESVESGSGGGVSDHGELTGLEDDDHPQYILRSILTTTGDLLVQGGSGAARLAIGTEGQVLKVVSGVPAWDDEAGGVSDHGDLAGLTDDDHPQYILRSILTTTGDLLVQGGSGAARLAIGTEGQVLKVVSGVPAWDDEAGGGASDAADVAYDNSASGLDATDVQAAIDELAALLASSAVSQYLQAVLDDSPVAFWRLDEKTGLAARDSSGNFIDVTFSGTPIRNQSPLIVNGVASTRFNSSGVIIGSQLPDLVNVNRTYEAWVMLAGTGEQRIVDWQDSAGFYLLRVANAATGAAVAQVNVPAGEVTVNFTIPADNQPHHVVFVRDTNEILVYVDGELEAQQSATGAAGSGTARAIGRHRSLNQNHWNGWMEEIAIYNYALSAERITAHYEIGSGLALGA